MPEIFGSDAYSPKQIADRIQSTGMVKATLPLLSMAALGVLAGGFIGLGALYYTIIVSDASLSYAVVRVLGGLVFSLGLILVVVAGAELFTGNNLMVMALIARKITFGQMIRNLGVVYVANFVGAAGLALLVYWSGQWKAHAGAVGEQAVLIAQAKVAISFPEAFFKGVLCNILVCLAVWLAMAAHSVSGKILAIIFPISAFVAAGFEHCVANMYFLPLGMLLDSSQRLGVLDLIQNLAPVTLGNIVGGAGMVGLVYYIIYERPDRRL